MTAPFAAFLVLIGIGTGIYGTLVGVGGGFVVVPLLLLFYPEMDPSIITSVSMAVVFFNALSGTIAYARMKRIDYRRGIPYALATVPGAVLGAMVIAFIKRDLFNLNLSLACFGRGFPGIGPAFGRTATGHREHRAIEYARISDGRHHL